MSGGSLLLHSTHTHTHTHTLTHTHTHSHCHHVVGTFCVNWSRQAILIFSTVAGESSWKNVVCPLSLLAALIASFMAKNTDAAKNNGGSPTAYMCVLMEGAGVRDISNDGWRIEAHQVTRGRSNCPHFPKSHSFPPPKSNKQTLEENIAFELGALSRRDTLNPTGTSENPGILYWPGPTVNGWPLWVRGFPSRYTGSSMVNSPSPCVNAPSTCPMSMAGLMLLPRSIRRSVWRRV